MFKGQFQGQSAGEQGGETGGYNTHEFNRHGLPADDEEQTQTTLATMSTHWNKSFKLLSWNVNVLGDKLKRCIVLQHIKRHSPGVVLLQESHLVGNTCKALNRWVYKLVAHSGFTTGSRGGWYLCSNTPSRSPHNTPGLMSWSILRDLGAVGGTDAYNNGCICPSGPSGPYLQELKYYHALTPRGTLNCRRRF